jgi:membrane-associated protein
VTSLLAGILNPRDLIDKVGLLGLCLIIFAESGLLVGFFLPGDSLLFTAGFFASGPASIPSELHLNLPLLLAGTFVAAVAGDQVGYLFGRRVGESLLSRPDSRLFKRQNVAKAQRFFDRHGSKTIVLARFVPVVRTFTPIVAGVTRMRYRTFVTYNLVGGLIWAVGVTLLGYFLGQVKVVEQNIEVTLILLVAISFVPIAIELLKARAEARRDDQPLLDAALDDD